MKLPQEFTELLDECAELIDGSGLVLPQQRVPATEPLPSLLERCAELVDSAPSVEPVRTLHHFACSGGTLIAKCLASMPNTRVLSEVEPHSTIPLRGGGRFFPTDLIQLLRTGTYASSPELETEVFLRGFSAIYEESRQLGLRLLLRDHAHSAYCVGPAVSENPGLRKILEERYELRSVVTVRHPLDCYLSIAKNNWLHFQPDTLNEFCLRHHRFLDDLADLEFIRYEDIVIDPQRQIERMTELLELPFYPDFSHVFGTHRLSGDSGRSGAKIVARPRRSVSEALAGEADSSDAYRSLCARLGYDSTMA